MKITVLLSGGGSNFQAILDAIQSGFLNNVEVLKVVSDRECQGINRAIDFNIDYEIIPRKSQSFQQKLAKAIPQQTDYVVLAGFLSIIPNDIIQSFPQRIINIHPSLLPKYGGLGMYGMNVHKAVVEAGDKESGCTVHFVNNGIDTGQILFQRKVPVFSSDTPEKVQKRVLEQEHQLFPIAIKYLSKLHEAKLPNAPLGNDMISESLKKKGINDYHSACHYVKNLPYKHNSQIDFEFVLGGDQGLCSTKHAMLKVLAEELNLKGIDMMLGIFKMNSRNTPQVAEILDSHDLEYIAEAHTYFKVNDVLLDFTTSESFLANYEKDIIAEQEFTPAQEGEWLINFHKKFLKDHIVKNNTEKSLEDIWAIREECVKAMYR